VGAKDELECAPHRSIVFDEEDARQHRARNGGKRHCRALVFSCVSGVVERVPRFAP
jgi:hypothetical protein